MTRFTAFALLAVLALARPGQAGARSFAYIPNSEDGTVSVIDTAENAVVATIAVDPHPVSVGIDPRGERVYIGTFGDNLGTPGEGVSVIDARSNRVLATIPGISYPLDMAVSPDGTRLFVLDGDILRAIDTATLTQVEERRLTGYLDQEGFAHLAISPDGTRIYVTTERNNRERQPCYTTGYFFCDIQLKSFETANLCCSIN
jgi:YVTN family beta-propeller protein